MTGTKFNGRYLVIDIGQVETKILDAAVSSNSIRIFNAVDMRDMTPFVSKGSGMLSNLQGFCESLKLTLKAHNIKTNRVLLTSSILDIGTLWEDKSSKEQKNTKELDKYYQEQIGRATSNLTISDYKIYGAQPSETELKFKVMKQKGNLTLLKDLVHQFHEVGLEIHNIESTTSASMNLNCLFRHTYDLPTIYVMDCGTSISVSTFKDGIFQTANKCTASICKMVNSLSEVLNIPAIKVKKYLYKIGVVQTPGSEQELYNDDIDAELYFDIITKSVNETVELLKRQTSSLSDSRGLGNYRILMTGGLMDIPGLFPMIESLWTEVPITSLLIESRFMNKTFSINNQMDSYVGSKYSNCIGVLLGNQYDKNINLLPIESRTVDTNTSAIALAQVGAALSCLSAVVFFGLLVFSGYSWWCYRNVDTYLAEAKSQLISAQSLDAKYKTYIGILDEIDDVTFPLIEFISQYSGTSLRIASIDSEDMLKDPEVTPNSEDIEEETPEVVIVDNDAAETTEEVVEDIVDKVTETTDEVLNVKHNIVIRGYATDSESITEFFNRLQEQDWISDLKMEGVKQITLNPDESFHIFEIHIIRG